MERLNQLLKSKKEKIHNSESILLNEIIDSQLKFEIKMKLLKRLKEQKRRTLRQTTIEEILEKIF